MLKRWIVQNFKPIHKLLDLELAPVTVLAGLNSSGKSSILQSILLLTQTLNNQNPERPLILNGQIIQQGTFDTVKNELASEDIIRIGFELSLDEPEPKNNPYADDISSPVSHERMDSIRITATFSPASERANDAASIEAVRVVLIDTTIEVTTSTIEEVLSGEDSSDVEEQEVSYITKFKMERLGEQEQREFLEGVKDEFQRLIPNPIGENYRIRIGTSDASGADTIKLARLLHFLPDRVVGKFDLAEREREEVLRVIQRILSGLTSRLFAGSLALPLRRSKWVAVLASKLEAESLNRVREAISETVPEQDFNGNTIGDLVVWVQNISKSQVSNNKKRMLAAKLKEILMAELCKGIKDTGFGLELVSDRAVAQLDKVVRGTVAFFGGLLRYLGPLRADPQAAQGFAPSNEPDDVGFKGEYAAAVYDANRKQLIKWWHPETHEQEESSLGVAIDVWVRYLGVAHHVGTREAGMSGVSWRVQHRKEGQERPLQAVGVGVSQVLPILVAGLLAPEGAVLLIEQPELHLHPRAQARLGDFFLGLSHTGKQCIIETHSDCLVNQLRYRMVQNANIMKSIKMYFVEQDADGRSEFRSVSISHHGNIVDWPDGFFDESLHQEDNINRESIKLRMNASKMNNNV